MRDYEQEYGILVNNLPGVVFRGYRDGSVDFFDCKIEQLTGYPKELFDRRRMKWIQLILEEDAGGARNVFVRALKDGRPYHREYRIRNREGNIIWIQERSHIVRSRDGKVEYVSGVLFDITEHKRAEEALRDRERLFCHLSDSCPIGIFQTDPEGRILYANQRLQAILGFNPNRDSVDDWTTLFHPEDREDVLLEWRKCDAERSGLSRRARLLTVRGDVRWVRVHMGLPRSETGQVSGYVGTVEDVTDRKRLEEELLRAKKLEAIGVLAGGIAHDFNNLLSIVIGSINLAQMNVGPESSCLAPLVGAEQAILRARDLSNRLTTFSTGGAPVKKTVRVKELLMSSVSLALSGTSVDCRYSFPDTSWQIKVDLSQICQVVYNLVLNAREAMPRGGSIRVTVANVDGGPRAMDARLPLKEGRYVKISFQDEGMGIPEENIERIFDPYFSTKERGSRKGTGMGLAMVHSIIKKHEGYIDVQSRPGIGTAFHLFLPASTEESETVRIPAPPEKRATAKGKVLLMDDEEMLRGMAGKMLGHLGYEAELAGDGEEAVEVFRRAKESGSPFDVVILDLTVRGGMGATEAVGRLLGIDPSVRAIVSSGYCNDPVMSCFEDHGFRGALGKPYDMQELSETLHAVRQREGPEE